MQALKCPMMRTAAPSRAFAVPPKSKAPMMKMRGLSHGLRCRAAPIEGDIISKMDKIKLDEMMERFDWADVDRNGVIDRSELRTLLESTELTKDGAVAKFTQHWLPDMELDNVMSKYDKDKNGVIDREEYKQIVFDGLLLDGQLAEYEAAFNAVDVSGNGTLGATELAKMFALMGNPQSLEKLVGIMQQYDLDESGQIEFDEFLLMFRNQLLELKEVQSFVGAMPKDREESKKMLSTAEGDMSLIFTEKELDEALAEAGKEKVVVVFSALTWCRPCKGMQRPAHKLAEQYKDTSVWVKLFGNANEQTKSLFQGRLKIRSTPCFMIFKDNKVVYTQTGINKENLEEGLRKAIGEGHPSLPKELVYPRS